MKLYLPIIALLIFVSSKTFGQDLSTEDLFADFEEETQQLLPDKIFFTQKALWGEKGLFRVTGISPLSAETRERELKIRRTMLKAHQTVGFIALAGMVAQGIVGSQLYNNSSPQLLNAHKGIAIATNISYGTTALLAFTAPPPLINDSGMSSIKMHKILAGVHLTGMIATNVLGQMVEDNPQLKSTHRATAITTLGAYAAAVIVIKF